VPGLKVNPTDVQTNIIVVELGIPNCDAAKFIAKAREDGVLILPRGSNAVRLVTHRDLSDELVDLAIERLTKTATELLKKSIA
jgi:threonine aldolase